MKKKNFLSLRQKTFVFIKLACVFLGLHAGFSFNASADVLLSDQEKIFKNIPASASLLTSSRFVVINDFNDGGAAGMGETKGTLWEMKTGGSVKANVSFEKEDARAAQRGHSMKIVFSASSRGKVSLTKILTDSDVSQASHLVFKMKWAAATQEVVKGAGFNADITVTLKDLDGRKKKQSLTKPLLKKPPRSWYEISIPLKDFSPLDFNRLSELEILVKIKRSGAHGELWLDEVAFFGPGPVHFESRRDNLIGFPERLASDEREQWLLDKANQEAYARVFLKEIARDTWKYFLNARDKRSHLVVDHIRLGEVPLAADYTSITNIAMDFLSTVAAHELGFISRKDAVKRTQETLQTLQKMKQWKGFFYNFYHTSTLEVTRNFISSVDSGWLAISLVVLRQAYPHELGATANRFLNAFNFAEFLDFENNQLSLGFDLDKGEELSANHYGLLSTEARATSYYGIGKGDLPKDHWWYIYRTPPPTWKWQNQIPKGKYVTVEGVDLFQGHYTYRGKKYIPSWGGGLFEFLMPTLVIKEKELAPKGLGMNNRTATECHRDYALLEKKYPVWGISPAAIANGRTWRYGEFGIKNLGAKGYPDQQIITPHVSFLALDSLPEDALRNIRRLLDFKIYGEYGFYDSLDLRFHRVNPQYLALDQGMILVAICNYLKNGVIKEYFHKDPVGNNAEGLLTKEDFFE